MSRKDPHRKNAGDNISVHVGGDAIGNAIGANASVNANVISGGNSSQHDEIERLFSQILAAVNTRPLDPKVDKEEIGESVQSLKQEMEKADEADQDIIKRRLRAISRMAPDILDVIIETFKSPAMGIAAIIHKVALKVKEEAQA